MNLLHVVLLSHVGLIACFSVAPAARTMPAVDASLNLDPECSDDEDSESSGCYTTAILKLAYDGTHFRGSAGKTTTKGNGEASKQSKDNDKYDCDENLACDKPSKQRRQSRRSRTLQRKGGGFGKNGNVRTVEGTLRFSLAKIYGDIDPNQVKINLCSRTDAGVHATSLVAQFYCSNNPRSRNTENSPIHPRSRGDTNFLPLPFDSDLSKLVFVLNRMLPPDVRVIAASPLPRVSPSTPTKVVGTIPAPNIHIVSFHPTLHAMSKTYAYKFAIGPVQDPIQSQHVWHLDGSSARAVGMNGKKFCLERALLAANLFVDSSVQNRMDAAQPRDYGAFRAAFRGSDRGKVQSTMCKLWRCEILRERRELLPSWETDARRESDAVNMGTHSRNGSRLGKARIGNVELSGLNESPQTFTVVITGDRFLYKMIRNIVGTIVAVGCSHLTLEDVSLALETGRWGGGESTEENENTPGKDMLSYSQSSAESRTVRKICAPARGLSLVEVEYPECVHFDWRSG